MIQLFFITVESYLFFGAFLGTVADLVVGVFTAGFLGGIVTSCSITKVGSP
jgi:hypothetical protein